MGLSALYAYVHDVWRICIEEERDGIQFRMLPALKEANSIAVTAYRGRHPLEEGYGRVVLGLEKLRRLRMLDKVLGMPRFTERALRELCDAAERDLDDPIRIMQEAQLG